MDDIVTQLWLRQERALDMLEAQHGSDCRYLLRRFLSSSQDVEEAMNDVLFRIWNSIPPAKPKNFKAYLAKTSRNTALHYIEKAQAKKRSSITLAMEELAQCIPDPCANIDPETFDLKDILNRFVRSLHGESRDFFLRRYYFGESVSEIAAACKCTENHVSVCLSRTRGKLRILLEKEGYPL